MIIVSNRAPINIQRTESGLLYRPATGGLATGIKSYIDIQHRNGATERMLWIGWPGSAVEALDRNEVTQTLLDQYGVEGVYLTEDIMERFYQGFCNKTLWPLFHYFPSFAEYDKSNWEEYISVNETFADVVASAALPNETIWVHDYHLLLLPALLRERLPKARIGFFLHVPFPSYEIFRLLPSVWRERMLEGMLGADLVGFHTPEYNSYFLRSIAEVFGEDVSRGDERSNDRVTVTFRGRLITTGAFPMGIEYGRFHGAVPLPEVQAECTQLRKHVGDSKLILSIDRQDYTKGILNRLDGYEYFLDQQSEWRGKVTMLMVVVPSRVGVENYQLVKSQIDEAVGKINGRYTSIGWAPIVYQYRELGFEEMIALYTCSDVALVTPLRDGMNLIAKEYVATRIDLSGVLILSEMAGAVDELKDALIINPNNKEEIGDALLHALEMPLDEQQRRMTIMQRRVEEYNVVKWANDFLTTLDDTKSKQEALGVPELDAASRSDLLLRFANARSRLILLDYDGTLTPHVSDPAMAAPSDRVLAVLRRLAETPRTDVAVISGRDKKTLSRWLGELPIGLAAEHGVFIHKPKLKWLSRLLPTFLASWVRTDGVTDLWKADVREAMQHATSDIPGGQIEEKEFSIAFHYRNSETTLLIPKLRTLRLQLDEIAMKNQLQILDGNMVIEVRVEGVHKGSAAKRWLDRIGGSPEFMLAIGDDTTDEDLFAAMPSNAFTIKVGSHPSQARHTLGDPNEVLQLLDDMADAAAS
jgi:trehalose 6-phosphate synthase/phosphatase